jgi:hypothetical protein
MQVERQVAHLLEQAIEDINALVNLGVDRMIVDRRLDGLQVHLERGQRLAGLVMQLAGDVAPFVFLGLDQSSRQLLEALVRTGERARALGDALLELGALGRQRLRHRLAVDGGRQHMCNRLQEIHVFRGEAAVRLREGPEQAPGLAVGRADDDAHAADDAVVGEQPGSAQNAVGREVFDDERCRGSQRVAEERSGIGVDDRPAARRRPPSDAGAILQLPAIREDLEDHAEGVSERHRHGRDRVIHQRPQIVAEQGLAPQPGHRLLLARARADRFLRPLALGDQARHQRDAVGGGMEARLQPALAADRIDVFDAGDDVLFHGAQGGLVERRAYEVREQVPQTPADDVLDAQAQ